MEDLLNRERAVDENDGELVAAPRFAAAQEEHCAQGRLHAAARLEELDVGRIDGLARRFAHRLLEEHVQPPPVFAGRGRIGRRPRGAERVDRVAEVAEHMEKGAELAALREDGQLVLRVLRVVAAEGEDGCGEGLDALGRGQIRGLHGFSLK